MALLLLSYAFVQSSVMQAAMASPQSPAPDAQPGRDDMAAMAMPSPPEMVAARMSSAKMVMAPMGVAPVGVADRRDARAASAHPPVPDTAKHHVACPYCSAAAHPPILTSDVLIRLSQRVAFTAYRVVASHGPRGPPSLQPRARGPPADPLTL